MLGGGVAVWQAAVAAALTVTLAAVGCVAETCQGVCRQRFPPYGSNYSVRYGKIPNEYRADADCVGNRRLQMRPYPGDCYGHDFDVFEPDAWWNLFSEIGGDLQYTFDFILYDPIVQSAEVNQFWYLLAYLQRLARLVTDPADVLTAPAARRALSAGRRAGSQRADRFATKLQAEISMLDALIVEAEGERRRRAPAAAAVSAKPAPARRSRPTKKTHRTKTTKL